MSAYRNPTKEEVADAINHGALKAQEDYTKAYASHIFNPRYCPEYSMKVYIFQSLLKLKRVCGCEYGLSLEQSVKEVIRYLPSRRGRYSKKLRMNGKCDLLIWDVQDDQEERPLAAIEVKESAKKYYSDINRLIDLVQRSLPFGIFASCQFKEVKSTRRTAEEELIQEADSMCQNIKRYLERLDRALLLECKRGDMKHLRFTGDEYRLVWCPVSFVISRKKDHR